MAKRYSAKLKFQVVLELLPGNKTTAQVAKAYGIHPVVGERMCYHNTERRHSAIGYLTPWQYIERVRPQLRVPVRRPEPTGALVTA